jgi:DNA-binding CsgD family transcriptional regulator
MGNVLKFCRQSPIELDLKTLLQQVSIVTPDDIRPAAEFLNMFCHSIGIRTGLCANIASTRPMRDADGNDLNKSVFGWADEFNSWVQIKDLALYCPIPRACRYESEPFWCDSDGFHGHSSTGFLELIDLSNYIASVRKTYFSTIIVPVHLPFGQVSANSFDVVEPTRERTIKIFEEYGYILGALTRRIISDYVSLEWRKKHIMPNCALSRREAECIKWAAAGKTDDEIAEILQLSRSTVRYHINHASVKLDAVNRTQTVYKATQLGYVSPL